MYDPTVGRFLSEDPIGMLDGVNSYRYVGNNPLTNIDPSGLCKEKSELCLLDTENKPWYPDEDWTPHFPFDGSTPIEGEQPWTPDRPITPDMPLYPSAPKDDPNNPKVMPPRAVIPGQFPPPRPGIYRQFNGWWWWEGLIIKKSNPFDQDEEVEESGWPAELGGCDTGVVKRDVNGQLWLEITYNTQPPIKIFINGFPCFLSVLKMGIGHH